MQGAVKEGRIGVLSGDTSLGTLSFLLSPLHRSRLATLTPSSRPVVGHCCSLAEPGKLRFCSLTFPPPSPALSPPIITDVQCL